MLELLAARGITRLMVEGGPTLAAALIAADLVDEAVLFHAAKVVGAEGLDALDAGRGGPDPTAAQSSSEPSAPIAKTFMNAGECDVYWYYQ